MRPGRAVSPKRTPINPPAKPTLAPIGQRVPTSEETAGCRREGDLPVWPWIIAAICSAALVISGLIWAIASVA